MAKIITVPNPLLRQKSKEVAFDKKTLALVKDLKETLVDKEGNLTGAGLAAVQIGVPKRVFVAYSDASKKVLSFINPEIIWSSKRLTRGLPGKNKCEGCLSVPNRWSVIYRPQAIKIRYLTENGQPQVRKFSGALATVIQHEYDHLNGVLFIDHALKQGSPIYELVKDEKGKEYLEEITLR